MKMPPHSIHANLSHCASGPSNGKFGPEQREIRARSMRTAGPDYIDEVTGWDGGTDGRMDGRMDGRTHVLWVQSVQIDALGGKITSSIARSLRSAARHSARGLVRE